MIDSADLWEGRFMRPSLHIRGIRMRRRMKSRIAFAAAALLALTAAALIALSLSWREAADTPPSPNLTEGEQQEIMQSVEGDGFPVVDWDYWQSVNPDVIGWITIPGTEVDSPIVQAPEDDPEYYLYHDIYQNYNPHGAIYLDADCTDGLLSRNAVIMGHHFGYDVEAAPFGIVASFTDSSFAEEHATILIQTPEWKRTYEVRFAQIVNGREPNKYTTFADDEDFQSWYDSSRDGAAMVLDDETEPESVVSLVTCSYNIWVDNERTVLVASEPETTQKLVESAEIQADGS